METFAYVVFRSAIWILGKLPLEWAFSIGQALGFVASHLAFHSRRLAFRNLQIAFGEEKSKRELQEMVSLHFQGLFANLLVAPALARLGKDALRQRITLENAEIVHQLQKDGRGTVWALNHMANWELISQIIFLFEGPGLTAIYQRLRNPAIDLYVRQTRARFGVKMVERKEGFNSCIATIRQGGIAGVLIDQHAGDAGLWTPFFGRLASTSPLPALLAARSGGVLIPVTVQTVGKARWKITFEDPLLESRDVNQTTLRLNQILEKQIRRSPHEWFWVHERWKTPNPEFLLRNRQRYRRGIILPEGMEPAALKKFRIVVRSSNWLGDSVMTVPAVRAIKNGRPDVHLTILCQAKLADFWKMIPEVDEVISIRKGQGVFSVGRMLKNRFDVGILFPNSMRSALEMWCAGTPRRVGYDRQNRRFLVNQIIRDPKKHGPAVHQSLHYLRLAETIGADVLQPADFALFPRKERSAPVRLGLCPGAEYGTAKRWLPERFIAVGQAISQRRDCEWMIFGVASEAILAGEIATQIGPSATSYAGQTSLAELIERLQQCSVLLTNDTGTMHLAALLGVPTVSIFGSTEPALTRALGPHQRILRHQVECSPCFLRECPIDFRCMKAVQVDEVVEAVLKSIDG